MSKRLRAAFMGSPDFAVPSLRAVAKCCELLVVVSQPDRPAGRGRKLKAPPVKVAAAELGVPVLQPTKVRDGSLVKELGAYELDLIVVTAYGRILPKELLELPRYGCINVHASALPRWRGAAPIQRAILAGDRRTGVSIMQMDEGCDTGAVFETHTTPIGSEETSGDLFVRLAELGGQHLESFLTRFPEVEGAQPQDESLALHAAKLEKREGEIDFARPAKVVAAHIRGMDPWPGAYVAGVDGKAIKLFGAQAVETREGEAGTIVELVDESVLLACGDGAVRVRELQAPGKRRMPAATYVRGAQLRPGELLRSS